MSHEADVAAHYGVPDLVARVEAALLQAGLGEGVLPWQALAPLDQFHFGGAAATAALAGKLGLRPGDRVLDVGCGLGGPSRHLAAAFGCRVDGIDLSAPFVAVARMLTQRAGLADLVTHEVADATRLPFADQSFDVAWTQHVAMNIADRRALYDGVFRVLRPGGRFAMFDVVAGPGGAPHFPVPWARDPSCSHLMSPADTRAVLEACGFTVLSWSDDTAEAMAWFAAQQSAQQGQPEPLRPVALPLAMGPEFPAMVANLDRSAREGRAGLLQAIVQRPG